MFTLIIISFLAGVLTVLAPCILPVLPIVIGGSLSTDSKSNKWRPFIITGSLAVSIVIFTLILKASTALISIPPDAWKWISGGIIIIFGVISIFPNLWDNISTKLGLGQKSEEALQKSNQKEGLTRDVLVGLSLGPVFSSCSPTYFLILATVLPASFATGLIALIAYALGLASILLLIALLGQKLIKKIRWAADPRGWFKRGLGILFVIVGVFIISGIDKQIETAILDGGYFDITKVEQRILETIEDDMSDTMQTSESIVIQKQYPQYVEISNPSGFVNTDAITLGELVGEKVILVDFMTYSCINCIRTYPYLVAWYDAYRDQGLEIVGIHTPEFAFERDINNVREAMEKHGIEFPIVLDNEYATWRAWGNRYWPRKYLIDINGNVVYDHIGEGAYDETEAKIVELLEERAAILGGEVSDMDIVVDAETRTGRPQSPETYMGALRGDYERTSSEGNEFFAPERRSKDRAYLEGNWIVSDEYVQPASVGSKILYDFRAKKVFLVMTSETTGRVRVSVDGEVVQTITVDEEDLYTLVDMPEWGSHTLELEFLDIDVQAFAFTFG